jgi:hypothetical protein
LVEIRAKEDITSNLSKLQIYGKTRLKSSVPSSEKLSIGETFINICSTLFINFSFCFNRSRLNKFQLHENSSVCWKVKRLKFNKLSTPSKLLCHCQQHTNLFIEKITRFHGKCFYQFTRLLTTEISQKMNEPKKCCQHKKFVYYAGKDLIS